jgi:hypothetical protein
MCFAGIASVCRLPAVACPRSWLIRIRAVGGLTSGAESSVDLPCVRRRPGCWFPAGAGREGWWPDARRGSPAEHGDAGGAWAGAGGLRARGEGTRTASPEGRRGFPAGDRAGGRGERAFPGRLLAALGAFRAGRKAGAVMAGRAVRESVTLAGRPERVRVARAFVEGVLGPGHPCGDDASLLASDSLNLTFCSSCRFWWRWLVAG